MRHYPGGDRPGILPRVCGGPQRRRRRAARPGETGAIMRCTASSLCCHRLETRRSHRAVRRQRKAKLRASRRRLDRLRHEVGESAMEHTREAWGTVALESTIQDIRHGIRQLRRNPAFACSGVLLLALGIAAITVVFSIVYGVLLRDLPYRAARSIGDAGFRTPRGRLSSGVRQRRGLLRLARATTGVRGPGSHAPGRQLQPDRKW